MIKDLRPKVYLDTNALNFICDIFSRKSKKPLSKYCFLFSPAHLDEIINCPSQWRQAELADFIWKISNRRVLLTIKDIISFEINSLLNNKTISFEQYFDNDRACFDAWEDARKGMIKSNFREQIQSKIRVNKQIVLKQLRKGRKEWRPIFENCKVLPDSWEEANSFLSETKHFNEVLLGMMKAMKINNSSETILTLNYKNLFCTSIGVEFYCCLRFLIDSRSRNKGGHPDAGDLYDIEHAFYTGLADIFVTSDNRAYEILHDFIKPPNTLILGSDEFNSMLNSKLNSSPQKTH